MTGAVITIVCAHQASTGVIVSARPDPVSRQGECWPPGSIVGENLPANAEDMGLIPGLEDPTCCGIS